MNEATIAGELAEASCPQKLLKPKQAAEVLAISPRKLWAMTASFEIPHIRIGAVVRYRPADLEEWISSKTVAVKSRRA